MFLGIILTANWYFFHERDSTTCLSKDPFGTIWTAEAMYGSYFVLFLRFYFAKTSKSEKTE